MAFNALLMCREEPAQRLLCMALDELGIEQEVCSSKSEALELLVHKHYSALVLDFDLPDAAIVARVARLAPSSRRPVIFALIGGLTEISGTFHAGANFVVYKPLEFQQVMRSLRAGRGFLQPDRRHSPRKKLETLVYLQFGIAALPAIVLDLNENGLALQMPEPLPPVQQVPLRFVLPGTTQMVEGEGEVIWADDCGRAGVFFAKLTPASRRHLKQWLSKRTIKKRMVAHALRPAKSRRTAPALAQ